MYDGEDDWEQGGREGSEEKPGGEADVLVQPISRGGRWGGDRGLGRSR